MKDFLRTADLSPRQLQEVLALSHRLKAEPDVENSLLAGETVVLYFTKPSTRTKLSTETAVARLGGVPISVGPNELQLGRGETIEDTARVISRYARAFVIRTYSDNEVRRFAAAATIPVINALTDQHHPLQSLADLMTLEERFGSLVGLPIAYVGDGNNVANSLMEAAALSGLKLRVATPPGYEPEPEIARHAQRLATGSGGEIVITNNPSEAVMGVKAVYTDVWVSMGTPEVEREARLAAFQSYQVDQALMAKAASDAIFLHCLPCHRDEEVSAGVVDGLQSAVFDQAENRLHTAAAMLVALTKHRLSAA